MKEIKRKIINYLKYISMQTIYDVENDRYVYDIQQWEDWSTKYKTISKFRMMINGRIYNYLIKWNKLWK